jgi:hypothetical protein
VWFFSYGCQLSALYGRVFPSYFSPGRLKTVADELAIVPNAGVRWTNFWRNTDPLGWKVPTSKHDVWVKDPVGLVPDEGEIGDPPIRNHSGYPDSGSYQAERNQVVNFFDADGSATPVDVVR